MHRRDFLEGAGAAAFAAALSPLRALAGQQSTRLTKLAAALDAQIPGWMKEDRVPGLSLVVIDRAGIALRRALGAMDAASGAPVTNDTMFEAASMSKPVFAYVVMKLCEDGVMDLDTPLTRYTPDRFLANDPRLDSITARHVLSHTSGFQNWRSDQSPLAIHFTPGSRYMYSGEGYNYLQSVVTHLLKRPFEQYMRERLFVPFGMTSSAYVWDGMTARRMARPHDTDGRPFNNNQSSPESVARYGSAGALLTTASDYARFVIGVIAPPPADSRRLSAASVREMLRPHVKLDDGRYPASWALGWQIFHNASRDFIYHGGDNKGFHCGAVASVAGKSGYVAMTNGENGARLLTKLLTADAMQEFLTSE